MLGLLLAAVTNAQPSLDEAVVKVYYTYNFGKFVDWPASQLAGPTLNLCVLGEDAFGAAAQQALADRSVKGLPLRVMTYQRGLISPDALDQCHILYISQSERSRIGAIVRAVGDLPILTVSDVERFSRRGGMITLVRSGSRIRFRINIDAVRRAGLSVSSKLLELAETVVQGS